MGVTKAMVRRVVDDILAGKINVVQAVEILDGSPEPGWAYLRYTSNGYLKVSTWPTREAAAAVAANWPKARVVPVGGRFGVQTWEGR